MARNPNSFLESLIQDNNFWNFGQQGSGTNYETQAFVSPFAGSGQGAPPGPAGEGYVSGYGSSGQTGGFHGLMFQSYIGSGTSGEGGSGEMTNVNPCELPNAPNCLEGYHCVNMNGVATCQADEEYEEEIEEEEIEEDIQEPYVNFEESNEEDYENMQRMSHYTPDYGTMKDYLLKRYNIKKQEEPKGYLRGLL